MWNCVYVSGRRGLDGAATVDPPSVQDGVVDSGFERFGQRTGGESNDEAVLHTYKYKYVTISTRSSRSTPTTVSPLLLLLTTLYT